MQLVGPEKQDSCNEYVVITRMLPLADANILELGCGNADITRLIAEKHPIKSIVAARPFPSKGGILLYDTSKIQKLFPV